MDDVSSQSAVDYHPLETGNYLVYDVQETLYTRNTQPVHRSFQLKETIGAAYSDVTGQTAYRLLRYKRDNERQPWQADSVWSARLVRNELIRSENGRDFVTLIYPMSSGLSWDGNKYNQLGRDDYEARNVGQLFNVLGKEFGETVTVVAQDDSTLLFQDKRLAVYARTIGIIYRERTSLEFCSDTPACLGKNQIDYGIRQIYRIQMYGKE